MIMRTILLFFVACLMLTGCANYKTNTSDIKATVAADGPFFAGSNSLIGAFELDMAYILEDPTFQEIEHISINEITVELANNQDISLDQFTSAAMQLVSDNNSMTSIAIMNPIKVSNNQLKLTVSNDADVDAFFKEGKFSVLLDLDFKDDSYVEELKAEIKMNLTIEYK